MCYTLLTNIRSKRCSKKIVEPSLYCTMILTHLSIQILVGTYYSCIIAIYSSLAIHLPDVHYLGYQNIELCIALNFLAPWIIDWDHQMGIFDLHSIP